MICLMYHRLASLEDYKKTQGTEQLFVLCVDEFEKQIRYLAENGYTFTTPGQAVGFVNGELELPKKSVMITFDDGCLSVKQYAIDVLSRYNACATLFVTTDSDSHIFESGTDRRLTNDELRQIDGDTINIESHSVTHRPLSGLSTDEIKVELSQSKKDLEEIVSRKIEYLTIPGNWFDDNVMAVAKECGYKAVWCSNPGAIKTGANRFGLPRLNVEGHMGLPEFIASIKPIGIVQRKLVSIIKRTPGRLIGPKYWLSLRKAIMRCAPCGYLSQKRIKIIAGSFLMGVILLVLAILFFTIK